MTEINKALGGTELMMDRLHSKVDPKLLEPFQIIASRVREIDPNKRQILYVHDLAQDPEVALLRNGGWKKFEKIVFVSHWQQQMYNLFLGVPFSHGAVIENAIVPFEDEHRNFCIPADSYRFENKPIRLIYTSTPHRGLNILYSAFEYLSEQYNIELDVYSSFKLYGWEQRDEQFRGLFEALDAHPKIRNHGTVSNEEIRKALLESDIFTYPSIWQETSCLCLIEAMGANLVCVHSSLAALPETAKGLTAMYPYSENIEEHLDTLTNVLETEIKRIQHGTFSIDSNRIVRHYHGIDRFVTNWEALLESI